VSNGAKLAGVIGWPIAHSLSPLIHNHWLSALDIDGAYVALPVVREEFSRAIDGLRRAGFVGLNVTLPHKQAAFAISDTVDEAARLTGAVNLLLLHPNGCISGRNTDVDGLHASLVEEFGDGFVAGSVAVVLGAGGAARAAAAALNRLGAGEVRILNRNVARAQSLATALQPDLSAKLVPTSWNELANATKDAVLLVNATSAGTRGKPALDISLDELPAGAAAYDLVYNPLETDLVTKARARGHKAAGGLGMLLYQAVPSFAAFYGVKPTITPELRGALERALSA
jgi:shikimate dehydrogenase